MIDPLRPMIQAIQLAGAGVVVWHGLAAIWTLVGRRGSIRRARLVMVQGVLSALGFTLAATLLRVIQLSSWSDIGIFAAIFALRTFVKQALLREQAALLRPIEP